MKRASLLLVAAITMTAATCSRDPVGPYSELAAARSLWEQRGPADYDFTYDVSCFCAFVGRAEVEVRGGEVVRATDVATGEALNADWFPTIEALFDQIASLLDLGADRHEVVYDAELGYPRSAFVDVFQMADEEMNARVERLEAR